VHALFSIDIFNYTKFKFCIKKRTKTAKMPPKAHGNQNERFYFYTNGLIIRRLPLTFAVEPLPCFFFLFLLMLYRALYRAQCHVLLRTFYFSLTACAHCSLFIVRRSSFVVYRLPPHTHRSYSARSAARISKGSVQIYQSAGLSSDRSLYRPIDRSLYRSSYYSKRCLHSLRACTRRCTKSAWLRTQARIGDPPALSVEWFILLYKMFVDYTK
jgi:hypothetical protein